MSAKFLNQQILELREVRAKLTAGYGGCKRMLKTAMKELDEARAENAKLRAEVQDYDRYFRQANGTRSQDAPAAKPDGSDDPECMFVAEDVTPSKPDGVTLPVYEAAVKGRQTFRRMFIDQKKATDRYGLALMMIREGCANPRGVAADALLRPESGGEGGAS